VGTKVSDDVVSPHVDTLHECEFGSSLELTLFDMALPAEAAESEHARSVWSDVGV